MVEYNSTGYIACQHPIWTIVMTSILLVPRDGALYRDGRTVSPEKRAVWRPEQKIMSRMKNVVRCSTEKGVGDRYLHWYLPHGESVYAA